MQRNLPVRNLLMVDDEPQILNSLMRELRQEGYRIYTANDGPAGLDIVRNHDIGVVLSDQMMPQMGGIAFLEEVGRLKPDTIRIMLTAHGSFESASMAINRSNVFGYLTKPWHSEDLKTFLRRAFEHHDLIMENRRLQRLTEDQNEQLQVNMNMRQSIFNAIAEPLLLVDEYLDILVSNEAASVMLYNERSFDPGCTPLLQELTERYGETIARAIQHSVRDSSTERFRTEVNKVDFMVEEISIHPVPEKSRANTKAVLRIRDITEDKRTERKQYQQEKLESLGLLMTGLIHEINNPNNFIIFNIPTIREYTERLLSVAKNQAGLSPEPDFCGMPYEEFKEDLLRLIETLERGAKRIDETLLKLRSVTHERGIQRQYIAKPGEIIEKALSVCQSQIKKLINTLDIQIAGNLLPMSCDPDALEEILINILINAAQAGDKENSIVRLRAFAGKNWKNRLVVEIEDNGCGMDKKTKERIFEPFFTTRKYGAGLGMGLYRSKMLIDDLGGTISVTSRPKEGTTFRVVVPDMQGTCEACC